MWQTVVSCEQLAVLGSYGFSLEGVDTLIDGFVVIKDDQVYAYYNQCPHRDLPLNWNPHQFWDQDRDYLLCAMHGALFAADSGQCIYGPCYGLHLKALTVRIQQQYVQVWIDSLKAS